jgi:hypothetical protein
MKMNLSLAFTLLFSLCTSTALAAERPQGTEPQAEFHHHSVLTIPPLSSGYGGRTIHVKAPASISEAIKKASRGDRIIVGPGMYEEQVLVKKSGIQLIGQGAIIVPPHEPTKNDCSDRAGPGTQAGICVAGDGIRTSGPAPEHEKVFSVRKPIQDVTITGFKVSGFSGPNIFLFGAKNARVFKNEMGNSPTYGFLSAGSVGNRVYDNKITNTLPFAFVGLCVDDFGNVEAFKNTISGYLVGLCIATPGALIKNNDVSNCCAAAFADPGVKGARIIGNNLHNSFQQCGDFGAFGIVIDGAIESEVRQNTIKEIRSDKFSAGISVVDDLCTGDFIGLACTILKRRANSENNYVTQNYLHKNTLDIFVKTEGAGNVIKKNKCSTVDPLSLKAKACRK